MEKTDYTKVYKELYAPKNKPVLIEVPAMQFIMVDGHGNPNEVGGEYQKAVELLYALSYTIKMNCINYSDPASFDYVVLPLEGLWWLEDSMDRDFTKKDLYCWTSMIRQPDFVTRAHFERAKELVAKKKPLLDTSKARLDTYTEGLCLHCMHIGPYDTEPETITKMDTFLSEIGKVNAIDSRSVEGKLRRHHEIYLSNPLRSKPENRKTILRHPVA
jgi:hypothetical protein